MVNNMHDSAFNKFDSDEKPFAKSMAIYFEHIYPVKDKGIFTQKPGPRSTDFYASKFCCRPNNSFLWYKAGWNDCYAHVITEADSVAVRKELNDYNKLFLTYYSKEATSNIELIELSHKGIIRQAEFMAELNADHLPFKDIRKVMAELTNQTLYVYPILAYIHKVIINMPNDSKVKAYNFAEKSYMSGYYIEDNKYVYEEYGHMGQNEWTSFYGPKDKVGNLYSGKHIINMEELIDIYNYIYNKYYDIISVYKEVHENVKSYDLLI